MAYLSFDASVKVHANGNWHSTKTDKNGNKKSGNGGLKGLIAHLAREADKADGIEVEHSNPNIDPELTENNQSFYKDENGEWQPVRHSSQLIDSVQRRIDEVQASSKKPIRHDACIVRPIVTQFGTEDMDEEEEERLIEAQVEFMEQEFGVDNITGFAIHRDETSMHIHWLMTPVTYRIERECLSKTPVVDDDGQPVLGKDGKQKIKKK